MVITYREMFVWLNQPANPLERLQVDVTIFLPPHPIPDDWRGVLRFRQFIQTGENWKEQLRIAEECVKACDQEIAVLEGRKSKRAETALKKVASKRRLALRDIGELRGGPREAIAVINSAKRPSRSSALPMIPLSQDQILRLRRGVQTFSLDPAAGLLDDPEPRMVIDSGSSSITFETHASQLIYACGGASSGWHGGVDLRMTLKEVWMEVLSQLDPELRPTS